MKYVELVFKHCKVKSHFKVQHRQEQQQKLNVN
jgi:hypothetical protein